MGRFGALVLLLVAGSAHAQALSSGATDNELYAAYCKGAMNGLEQEGNTEAPRIGQRFSSYLFSTGVMTDPRRRNAIMGLSAAMTHGLTDQRQCTVTVGACNQAILGSPDLSALRGLNDKRWPRLEACVNSNPACPRAMRCNGPDALPF